MHRNLQAVEKKIKNKTHNFPQSSGLSLHPRAPPRSNHLCNKYTTVLVASISIHWSNWGCYVLVAQVTTMHRHPKVEKVLLTAEKFSLIVTACRSQRPVPSLPPPMRFLLGNSDWDGSLAPAAKPQNQPSRQTLGPSSQTPAAVLLGCISLRGGGVGASVKRPLPEISFCRLGCLIQPTVHSVPGHAIYLILYQGHIMKSVHPRY